MKHTIAYFFSLVISIQSLANQKQNPALTIDKSMVISSEISNQQVSAFAEDAFGHIWISTIRGLNKFNINEYHQYFNTNDSLSISDNRINQVYTDSKNRLWVATINGISRYNDQDCFDQIPISSVSNNAIYFFENLDGKLFVSLNFEICVFNEQTQEFTPVIRNLDHKNFRTSCFVDYSNNIWVVTPWKVACYDSHNYKLIEEHERKRYTTFSYLDKTGKLWLASWSSLEIYDIKKGSYTSAPQTITEHPLLKDAIIHRMYPYNQSSLIIFTQKHGLFLFNTLNNNIIHQSESGFPFLVPDYEITAFYIDSQKNIWMGSFDQGYTVRYNYEERFNNNIYLQSKLNGLSIISVATDLNNNLWMVTRLEGIKIYRGDNHDLLSFPNSELFSFWETFQHKAKKVYIDQQNNIWILSDWMLVRSRFENNKIDVKNWYYFPTGILSVTEDAKGTIWLGGLDHNIYYLDKGMSTFQEFHLFGKEYNFTPIMITLSSGDVLLASFNHDLQIIKAENREILPIPIKHLIKKSLFIPVHLFEDAFGDVWIGTINNGIFRLNMAKKSIEPVNGIGCSDISSLTEDISGNIWVGTLFGLSKYDRTSQQFINFYSNDGIGGNQFNEQSVCRLPDNTLVFGGTHGLTLFNPQNIKYREDIPLLFEVLKIHNKIERPYHSKNIDKHLSFNPKITLEHYQNSFALSFSAIDYGKYERVKYAYKLEGFDKLWIEANNSREAYYSNVPAGRYTFRVKIYNDENTIKETQNEIKVHVKPAPWMSWPALTLYFLIFVFLLIFAVHMQHRITLNLNKARQAEREKEQEHKLNIMNMSFFANLSHEFRTPLTMIAAPVATLSKDVHIKGEAKQLIHIIQKSVNRMLRLVNQLMDFNKLENDTLKLKVKLCNIVEELRRSTDIFQLNAREKEIEFKTYGLEDNFETWLDADKLEKIMANLLSNALKFSNPGGNIGVSFDVIPLVEAKEIFPLTDRDDSTKWVKIIVSDTGKGIPHDKLEKVFERYYQLDNQSSDKYNWGTGIGLYFTRRLVELHHGYIKATNRDEAGVNFTFILPVSEMAYASEERKPDSEDPQNHKTLLSPESESTMELKPESKKDKPSLLIIDDDIDIVHYLKTLLSPQFEISYRFDADSAFKALKDIKPDLILCDVVMPGSDGYAFSRNVKDSLDFCHIPVILVTAKASVDNQVEGLNSGADAYVTKPFDPNYLLALINSQLSNRRKIQTMLVSATKTERLEKDILTPQDNNFMSELYQLMENELSNPELNINRMTDVLKISRTKFYYKVKGLTGENPAILFKTYKLNRAAEFILEGKMNISEIADITGFSTPSHFSVSFKKHFGVSPKNYRG